VTSCVSAVSDRSGEVQREHAAVGHRHRERVCQPGAMAQLRQHRGARVRDEIAAVGSYLCATHRAATMHLQGGLLLGRVTVLEQRDSPSGGGLLRGYWQAHAAIARMIEANEATCSTRPGSSTSGVP
jgi:hypothetical protein